MAITTTYNFSNSVPEFTATGTATVNNQYDPTITALNDGGFVVGYTHVFDPSDRDVQGRYFSSAGVGGPDVYVANAGLNVDEDSAAATTLSNGNVVVVYTDEVVNAGGLLDVNFKIYSPTGALIRGETPVPLTTKGLQYDCSVTALAGGGFAVTWGDNQGSDGDVKLRTFNAAGEPVSGEITIASEVSSEDQSVVAGLSNGNVVVVWRELSASGTYHDVKGAIYSASGALIRSEFTIDQFPTVKSDLTVLALPGGGFAVAYTDGSSSSTLTDVTVKSFTNAGDFIAGVSPSADSSPYAAIDPSLSLLDNGFLVVTWTSQFSPAGDDYDIHARIIDPGTLALVTGQLTIENQSGIQVGSTVAGLDAGRFVTAWTDFVTTEDGSGSAVRAQIDELSRSIVSDDAGDVLAGDELRDLMFGNGGNDVFRISLGNDALDGGSGRDTMTFAALQTTTGVTVKLATGTFTLPNGQVQSFVGIEDVVGTAFADSLTGDGAANRLTGLAGNDRLVGGAGNDTLMGGGDKDKLFGGANNDRLIGGNGADSMTGGPGADLFDYDSILNSGLAAKARDIITDFQPGLDKIDLSTIDANTGVGGNQAFAFIGSAGFSAPGQVRAFTSGGNTIVQLSNDADTSPEMNITLIGLHTLSSSDFVL